MRMRRGPLVLPVLEYHGFDGRMGVFQVMVHGGQEVRPAGEGDIQERRVDVLDDVVVQGVFKAGEFCAGPEGHGIAISGVSREVVNAVEIPVVRQTEPGRAAGGEDHGAGVTDHQFSRYGC